MHALGREGDAVGARSPVLVAAIAIVIALAWSMLLLGLRGLRALGVVLGAALAGWLALDLRWQVGLMHRLLATRALHAGHDWPERARRVGDSGILRAAEAVRALLRDEPAQRRILVFSDNGYSVLRMIWHLQPLNAAPFWHAARFGMSLPEGTVIVFQASDAWYANPTMRRLLADSERLGAHGSLHADGFEVPDTVVFRFHHAR